MVGCLGKGPGVLVCPSAPVQAVSSRYYLTKAFFLFLNPDMNILGALKTKLFPCLPEKGGENGCLIVGSEEIGGPRCRWEEFALY